MVTAVDIRDLSVATGPLRGLRCQSPSASRSAAEFHAFQQESSRFGSPPADASAREGGRHGQN